MNPLALSIHQQESHSQLGAFPVRGPGFIPQDDSFLHVATALAGTNNVRDDHGQPEPRPAPILNEVFVKDPEIASSSIADQKAVEKSQCWPQRWRVLATVLVIGILVSIIAIVIKKLTEPGLSARPTLAPSASPSQSLSGFLAGHSFDNGAALSTPGSSQQLALSWLQQLTLDNMPRDYTLLQFYALAVFNYATGDRLSKNTCFSIQLLLLELHFLQC